MNKKYSLFIIGILFLINCYGQNEIKDSLEKVTLENCRITELIIPNGSTKTERYNYTEGNVQTFYYADSSFITIVCGSLMHIKPHDNKQKDKFWREERIRGRTILYGNVNKNRVEIFDKAFDKMIINSINAE